MGLSLGPYIPEEIPKTRQEALYLAYHTAREGDGRSMAYYLAKAEKIDKLNEKELLPILNYYKEKGLERELKRKEASNESIKDVKKYLRLICTLDSWKLLLEHEAQWLLDPNGYNTTRSSFEPIDYSFLLLNSVIARKKHYP